MRYLLTALCLLPSLVLAQELHTFKNGEVADAGKVNQNFDALKDQLLLQTHPEGDLFFRYSDESTLTWQRNPSLYTRDREEITLDQEDGSSWGPITQTFNNPAIYSQQGISFERHLVTRVYPLVGRPDICPEDALIAIPVEVLETFSNQYGSITQGTSWDFGDSGSPSPESMANNSTGFYACITNTEVVSAGRFDIKGATGRYKCASSSGEMYFAVSSSVSSYAELSAVGGLSTVSFRADSFADEAIISADIPATCEEAESRSSIAPPSSKVMTVFGIEVEVPPIQ